MQFGSEERGLRLRSLPGAGGGVESPGADIQGHFTLEFGAGLAVGEKDRSGSTMEVGEEVRQEGRTRGAACGARGGMGTGEQALDAPAPM